MIDFAAILYPQAYAIMATTATLFPVDGEPVTIAALDKTVGVQDVPNGRSGVATKVGEITIRPAAVIRASDLATLGVATTALKKAVLTMNGKEWRVENHQFRPSPRGEADGEIWLYLIEN